MPIDLETPEAYLFAAIVDGRKVVLKSYGRTEAEARHRLAAMSPSERRRAVVVRLERGETDLIAAVLGWIAALAGRRPDRRIA